MRRAIRAIALAGSLAAFFVASAAHATPDFPPIVATVVGASSAPACTICHNNPNGGLGTATTAFGTYMRSRGLVAYDENSLRNALAAATAEKHDSNGDGVTDVDALKQGLDPNGASNGAGPVEYGCVGRIASARQSDETHAVGAALVIAFAAIVRRRRRVSDRSSQA